MSSKRWIDVKRRSERRNPSGVWTNKGVKAVINGFSLGCFRLGLFLDPLHLPSIALPFCVCAFQTVNVNWQVAETFRFFARIVLLSVPTKATLSTGFKCASEWKQPSINSTMPFVGCTAALFVQKQHRILGVLELEHSFQFMGPCLCQEGSWLPKGKKKCVLERETRL